MNIGYLIRSGSPTSMKVYFSSIRGELEMQGIKFVDGFDSTQKPDLYWDVRCSGGRPPLTPMLEHLPYVVTNHGASSLSLNYSAYKNPLNYMKTRIGALLRRSGWKGWSRKISHLISVSDYALSEIQKYIPETRTIPSSVIYHGVNKQLFNNVGAEDISRRGYILHVSSYQAKKNVEGIIRAYCRVSERLNVPLKIVSPGAPEHLRSDQYELINHHIDQEELAKLYREALCFIFPSFHETFGLPIMEAMASGTPVITSNSTACVEIAGEDAIIVDPHSIEGISKALVEVVSNQELRASYSRKGLNRAEQFTWKTAAQQHLEIFSQILPS